MHIQKLILALVALGAATLASAQGPRPLAAPDLDLWRAGSIEAMVPTADGGVLIGGSFTLVQGVPRTGLAKLNADGSLDLTWDPRFESGSAPVIKALAVGSDGTVFVGGSFSAVDGFVRNGLAKLRADGSIDWEWNPYLPGSSVVDLEVIGPHVYVARFVFAGGDEALVRIANTGPGAVDPLWDPTLAKAGKLASDGSSFIYVANNHYSGGAPNLTRIPIHGSGPVDGDWQPEVVGAVHAMAFDGDGNLIIGGDFWSVQGIPRGDLAKISLATGAATVSTWNASVDGRVSALAVVGNTLHVGGFFTSAGGEAHHTLARFALSGSGAVDSGWNHEARGAGVTALAVNSAGQVVIGGGFAQLDSAWRSGVAVIDPATDVLQASPAFEALGVVSAMAARPDGGVVIGGIFSRIGAAVRHNLAVLDADGNVDPAWKADALGLPVPYVMPPDPAGGFESQSFVAELQVDATGRVYAGGSFDRVEGVPRGSLVRLLADGSVDAGWDAGVDGTIGALRLAAADQLLVGGNFSSIGNLPRSNLARLSTAPGAVVDPVWAPSIGHGSEVMALLPDGTDAVYVGGAFGEVNGEFCCSGIARISSTGSGARDPGFDLRFSGGGRFVRSLALDAHGRLYLAGRFQTLVQGAVSHPRYGVARLAANGLVDAWQPLEFDLSANYEQIVLHDERVYIAENGWSNRVLALETGPDANAVAGWNVSAGGGVHSLLARGDSLLAGGAFMHISQTPRRALAALPLDRMFRDGFDD